jgi:hypothetical protein
VDEDGNLLGNGIAWNALQQRDTETYVSVNWLEYHDGTKDQQLKLVRDDLAHVYERKKNGEALLAIANVGVVKKMAEEASRPVRVTHEPNPTNLSHTGIRQLSNTQNALMDRLAAEAFAETVLACKY